MAPKKHGKYRFNDFEVDLAHRSLLRDGNQVSMSPKTFELLSYFVLHPQQLVLTDSLLQALWPNAYAEESNLSQHIFLLRKALSSSQPGNRLILSIANEGYRFNIPVNALPNGTTVPSSALESPPVKALVDSGRSGEIDLAAEAEPKPSATSFVYPQTLPSKTSLEDDFPRCSHIHVSPRVSTRKSRADDEESSERDSTDSDGLAVGWHHRLLKGFRASRPARIGALAAFLIALAVAALLMWSRFKPASISAGDHSLGILIGDFENSTANLDFDIAIRTALAIDLGQSPYLNVTPDAKVAAALRGQADKVKASSEAPADTVATGARHLAGGNTADTVLTRTVCRSLGDQVWLAPELRRLGQNYMISVRAFDCASGKSLAESRGVASSPDRVLLILDRVSLDLRKQLGESSLTLARFKKPLFDNRTSSLEAFKAYAQARALIGLAQFSEAIPLLHRAIALDPKFALAFADLGVAQSNLAAAQNMASTKSATHSNAKQTTLLSPASAAADATSTEAATALRQASVTSLTRAYELRESVDDEDRFFITSIYNNLVTLDLQGSIRNAHEWAEAYPRNPAPSGELASLLLRTGQAAQALEPARKAIELDPDNPNSYELLARAQMHLGQYEEAANTCNQASAHQVDSDLLHGILLQIAFLRLDQPAIDSELDEAKGTPSAPYMLEQEARMRFADGKVKAGHELFARAIAAYRAHSQPQAANRLLALEPRILAEFGLTEAPLTLLRQLRLPEPAVDSLVASATIGEITRAQSQLQNELDAHPASTAWVRVWAPQVRASVALNQHRPDDAIEALQAAAPFDLAGFELPLLRGKACLALRQPEQAEVEFRKILEHPGIDPLSHQFPLARLGVARALVAQNKLVDAGFAYKIVLQIWAEADFDLPVFKAAKAEAARLATGPVSPAQITVHSNSGAHAAKAIGVSAAKQAMKPRTVH